MPTNLISADTFNKQINYQGKLTNSAGVAVVDGDYNLEFKIYSVATGGSALWTESRTVANRVTVTNGMFSVMLGEVTPITSLDWNQTLYLGVNVGGAGVVAIWDGEMTPRKILGSVPSAFQADKLDNLEATQFVRSDATSTIAVASADTALIINQTGAGSLADFQVNGTSVFSVNNAGLASTTALKVTGGATVGTLTATGLISASDITVSGGITLGGVYMNTWPAGGSEAGSFWATTTNSLIGYPSLAGSYAVVVGGSATTSPDTKFEVVGNTKLSGNLDVNGTIVTRGGTLPTFGGAGSIVAYGQSDATHSSLMHVQIPDVNFANGGFSVGYGTVVKWLFGISKNNTDPTALTFFEDDFASNPRMTIATGGNVGIGTTSPYAPLSVNGQAVALYFTATSTTQASTFPYASTTALTVSGTTYLGTLTGPLQAINGLVSASSTLSVAYGGTGASTFTSNGIIYGNGTGALQATLAGTNNYLLYSNNGTPAWTNAPTILGTNITGLSASNISAGTLAVAQGGTGQTAFAQGWLSSDGATITSSTSPTVNYITATSTTATSTFAGGSVFGSNALVIQSSSGNVGIGTAAPTSMLTLASNSTYDNITYGSELTDGTGWTSTNWTGDYATGFTHTAGNTSALSRAVTYTTGHIYQVSFTIKGQTPAAASQIVISMGGMTSYTATNWPYIGYTSDTPYVFSVKALNDTDPLSFVPGSTFNGTIASISVKEVTGTRPSIFTINNSAGSPSLEIRAVGSGSTGRNTAIGYLAGQYLDSSVATYGMTAIGANAMSAAVGGWNSTAIGTYALLVDTNPTQMTAIGYGALKAATAGAYANTAVGANVLDHLTTGFWNTAVGDDSGGLNTTGVMNTYMGVHAGLSAITGNYNTAIGSGAMFSGTGNYNTALGFRAGESLAIGNNNIFIGNFPAPLLTSGSYNIFIGDGVNSASTTQSNFLNIGNTLYGDLSNKNIGIGTTSPLARLDVAGGLSQTTPLFQVSKVGASYATSTVLIIDSAGLVGIGTATPGAKLDIAPTAVGTALRIYSANDSFNPIIEATGYRTDVNQTGQFAGTLALGHLYSGGAETNSYGGSYLGQIIFGGNQTDGTYANMRYAAGIAGIGESTFTNASTMPTALTFYTGSTGGLKTDAIGTEQMRITSAGNVGIGTTIPRFPLHLVGNMMIATSSAAVGGQSLLEFNYNSGASWGANNQARLVASTIAGGGGDLWLQTAPSASGAYATGLTILGTNQNVGIGKTNPVSTLSVGTVAYSDVPTGTILDLSGAVASGALGQVELFKMIRSRSGGSYAQAAAFTLGRYVADGVAPRTRLDINLRDLSANGSDAETTVMSLQSNGNVGVGTSSPDELLSVGKLAGANGQLALWATGGGASAGGKLLYKMSVAGGNALSILAEISPVAYGTRNNNRLDFKVGTWNNNNSVGDTLMTIVADGTVGIGTTSPLYSLDVWAPAGGTTVPGHFIASNAGGVLEALRLEGAANQAAGRGVMQTFYVANNSNTAGRYGGNITVANQNASGAGTYLTLSTENTSGTVTERLRIDQSGNLGIGTTTPSNLLSIYNSATPSTISLGPATGGTSYNGLWLTNAGVTLPTANLYSSVADQNLYINRPVANDIVFAAGQTTEQMRLKAATGNLGIGTAAPNVKLDVLSGTANTAGNSVTGSVANITGPDVALNSADVTGVLLIDSNDTRAINKGGSISLGGRYNTAATARTGFATIKGAAETVTDGEYGGYLAFGTHKQGDTTIAERMRITSTGNVGIGTVTPAQTLDIVAGGAYGYNGTIIARASTTKNNYFFGPGGNLTMSGSDNNAFGSGALAVNTTGSYNMAIGGGSLTSNQTGWYNTAVGLNALNGINSNGNTGVGFQAGGVGYGTDYYSRVDTNSTFVGYSSGRNNNVASTSAINNATALGYNAKVGCSNCLVLGGTGADAVNVGIGTSSPDALLTLYAPTPTLAGYVSIPGGTTYGPAGVAVAGRYAYVVSEEANSLSVVDISDSAYPVVVGVISGTGSPNYLGRPISITVAGRYAYVGARDDTSLTIIDISNPAKPTYVGHVAGSGSSNYLGGLTHVAVVGRYVYVAAWSDNSLTIVDVASTTNPTVVGHVAGAGAPNYLDSPAGVYVSGRYAYVAVEHDNSLTIVDVSNVTNPTVVGHVAGAGAPNYLGGAIRVTVAGRYAYVAANVDDSLTIVDVASTTNPTVVGHVAGAGAPNYLDAVQGVVIAGRYAYLSSWGDSSITVVDVASTTNPKVIRNISNIRLLGPSIIVATGRYIYVPASVSKTLTIIDISGIEAPAAAIGTITAGNLTTTGDSNIGNNLYVGSALNVGIGGIFTNGGLSVNDASYFGGNVGIGTTSPIAKLSILDNTAGTALHNVFVIATSTNKNIFRVDSNGQIFSKILGTTGADYAEYFYTNDTDLVAGETVCLDILRNNAIKRCTRGEDPNLMGIVSTNPAVVGNSQEEYFANPHYKTIGLLGQLPAKVSAENGPIESGDSLTSASSTPGYVMKANAGDSTVGVALESLANGTGVINVLISRRNQSLTVEQVEAKVSQHIAEMKIEDEVQKMITVSADKYDWASQLTVASSSLTTGLNTQIALSIAGVNVKLDALSSQLDLNSVFSQSLTTNILASTTALVDEKLLSVNSHTDNSTLALFGTLTPVLIADIFASTTADLANLLEASSTPFSVTEYLTNKIDAGFSLLKEFTVAKIVALYGYFEDLYANRVHTKTLCLGDGTDNSETCITKSQLDQILNQANVIGTQPADNNPANSSASDGNNQTATSTDSQTATTTSAQVPSDDNNSTTTPPVDNSVSEPIPPVEPPTEPASEITPPVEPVVESTPPADNPPVEPAP